jgi:PAS domain S-box-containing protein
MHGPAETTDSASSTLSTLLGLCLRASHPALVIWGEQQRCFFNSAAAPVLEAPPDLFGQAMPLVLGAADGASRAATAALAGESSVFTVRGATFFCTPVDESGRIVGAYCVAPAEARAAEALRLSEERFRTALKHVPIIVGNQDLQLRYTWLHDSTDTWSLETVFGKRDRDLLDEPDAEVIETLKRQVLDSGAGARQEVRVRRDGVDCYFDLTVEPLRDPAGAVVGITSAAVDITRHHLLEGKLRDQAKQLADADRRKDEFLAMLGHELRNPLSPIANGIHVLKTAEIAESVRARTLVVMERQVHQMVRLLDDLLDVSRIARGKIRLQRELVPVGEVLQNAVDTCLPLISQRGHRLDVRIPDAPLRISVDPDRMAQVFANLLHNAAKYTDDGGRISVTVSRWGREVLIEVRDTGIGIHADLLPGIFDLFRQGDESHERARGGLGLGLTVVRRIVEMHGGSVGAFSAGAQKGSEFVVRLPLQAEEAQSPAPVLTSLPRRILVVDDNVDAARSLAVALTARRHEVHCVHTPMAALHAAESFAPDIVVLDIGLPGMDGYEVARLLRSRPRERPLLLVAVTGYSEDRFSRRAEQAGFDHAMLKPVNVEALQAVFDGFSERNRIIAS